MRQKQRIRIRTSVEFFYALKINSFPHKGNLKLHAILLHSDAPFTACFQTYLDLPSPVFLIVELSDHPTSDTWESRPFHVLSSSNLSAIPTMKKRTIADELFIVPENGLGS